MTQKNKVHLYTSNRLESLAEMLAEQLREPLQNPFTPDTIIVQSRGMARWLSYQIADHHGVCMNADFPFPRRFIEKILATFFGEKWKPASPEAMLWKIFVALPKLQTKHDFAHVKNYLAADDGMKRYQLARRLANLFDQYLLYRPEMILRWEAKKEEPAEEWQAILWREISGDELQLAHISEKIEQQITAHADLPQRLCIFGISSLPPLYLRIFHQLAKFLPVHLFLLQPSQEFLERGEANPLLNSLGRMTADFTKLRMEQDERMGQITVDAGDHFAEADGENLLQLLQHDLLVARDPAEVEKREISADDRSISIHSCHSPMREVEVLYDQLLDIFAKDPELRPRDVLVMTPNIEQYAPYIQAVFDSNEKGLPKIPFDVADRNPCAACAAVDTFLRLLELGESRFTAPEILALLESPLLRKKFGFTDDEIATIKRWLSESGIRWGLDAQHRAELQLPEIKETTWEAGKERLLLGYAMAGGNHMMFNDILPADEVEGTNSEVLGRLLDALEALKSLREQLRSAQPLSQWPRVLREAILVLLPVNEAEEDIRHISFALAAFEKNVADVQDAVSARVVRTYLAEMLSDTEQRGNFLSGTVTFCAIKPMRAIPARVLCLIGMNDREFPRRPTAPNFDLMRQDPQLCDRLPPDDDRYAFLEALISAREQLYISYCGRSIVDDKPLPSSVVVSELLDYIDQTFSPPQKQAARGWLVTQHPLHGFSRRYFENAPRLFSYSPANAAACDDSARTMPSLFCEEELLEPPPEMRNVELEQLIRFFKNPARQFVRQRLQITLSGSDDELEESERFTIDNLQQYGIKQELLDQQLASGGCAGADLLAARGVLPLKETGRAQFAKMKQESEIVCAKVRAATGGMAPQEPVLVDRRIGDFTLTGSVESIYDSRLVQFRGATLKAKDFLSAWLRHLALCANGSNNETLLIGSDQTVPFACMKTADEILAKLLKIYWEGLFRPRPFFPEAALAYCQSERSPLQDARTKWRDGYERPDRYVKLCFGNSDPLNAEFKELATDIFKPLLEHIK